MANAAKLPVYDLNFLAISYVALRLAYGIAYIRIESENLAVIRTLIWWTSNIQLVRVAIKAAKVLHQ